jgi:protein-disulfide isomerase
LLRAAVAVGAGASILLTIAMFVEGSLCGYCLAIHVLNLAFAIGHEFLWWPAGRHTATAAKPANCVVVFLLTFMASSLLLAAVDHRIKLSAADMKREQLKQALSQAGEGTQRAKGPKIEFASGRYVLGAKSAPVHVVVVSDYQCPSCRVIDEQLRAIAAGRDDIAISARHFPFCTDCNQHIDKTRHPNACRAALAAEAAGSVGGNEAFWKVHNWLFEHGGDFSDHELRRFIRKIDLNEDSVFAAMQAETTFALIRADVEAADAAGLQFTPMVFINGNAIDIGR